MDPLVSLHYFAPVCALMNIVCLPFMEGWAPFLELARIGPLIFISNASIAFLLNVASVLSVGAASGLVLTLAGVLKVSDLLTGFGWLVGRLVVAKFLTTIFISRISSS